MDEDDAAARGFALDELVPPHADDDAALRELMIRKLPAKH